eukprot:COSAG06_NODE_50701_length_317_cov_0.330275_1_plen_36_part_01
MIRNFLKDAYRRGEHAQAGFARAATGGARTLASPVA